MKLWKKRLIALLVTLVMTFAIGGATVFAEQDYLAPEWDIILLVDGSGSLKRTDGNGQRFEAIRSLLSVLDGNRSYVGVKVFTAKPSAKASTETVASFMDEPIRVLGNDFSEVEELTSELEATRSREGDTDIGTALLYAQEELAARNNDHKKAIFIFTDGETYVSAYPKAHSEENGLLAQEQIRKNEIMLFGVYLNADGRVKANESSYSTELAKAVKNSNGIGNAELRDYYLELTNATDILEATDVFLKALGYKIEVGEGDDFTDELNRSFRIPGIGVEQVSIRIEAKNGQQIPSMRVTITCPDGSVLPASGYNFMQGSTFRLYKLDHPSGGEWNVHVEVEDKNNITLRYTKIWSVNIGSEMETDPADTSLFHANMDAQFIGRLTQNDVAATDYSSYQLYDAQIEMTNTLTNETQRFPMTWDANAGGYAYHEKLGYGIYEATVVFSFEDISVASNSVSWDAQNHIPEFSRSADRQTVLYGLLQETPTKYDVAPLIWDVEDGSDLALSIVGGTCDLSGVELINGELVLDGEKCGSGTVVVEAVDSVGATAQFTLDISAHNRTPIILAIAGAIIIALCVSIFLIVVGVKPPIPRGAFHISFFVPDENGNPDINVEMEASPPNTGKTPARTTLYDVLIKELEDPPLDIKDPDRVKNFVESYKKELKGVKISVKKHMVDVGNANKRKEKRAKLIVAYSGEKKELYTGSGSANPYVADQSWMLSYSESDNIGDDGGFFDNYAGSYAGGSGSSSSNDGDGWTW